MAVFLAATLLVSACGSPRAASRPEVVRDAYYHRMITSGHGAFQRGDISRAFELYENALMRAQIMDRPAEIGSSAYNLALCRIALGDLESARQLLREGRLELRRSGESGVDTLLAEAEVARHLDEPDAAWELTDEALAALQGLRERAWVIQLHALRALLALERKDLEAAEEELAAAQRQVRRDTPLRLSARLAEVRGRLLWADTQPRLAAQEFDLETMYYSNDGRFADMARAMTRAAEAYAEAREYGLAADRYYRSARHFAADGRAVEALQRVEQALPNLEKADNPELERRIAALFGNLSEIVKSQGE